MSTDQDKSGPGKTEVTLGEERVRFDFNPDEIIVVDEIKLQTAALIDLCEAMKERGRDARLVALAQTAYEQASMWAVKAATS